jgi:hypothetical protein
MFLHLIIEHGIFPDYKCSLNFLANILFFKRPNAVQSIEPLGVSASFVLISSSPVVEHVSEQVVAVPHVDDVVLLLNVLNWFECLLEPLFESNSHFVMAEFVENSNKTLQSTVASLVKSAVVKELVHSILFALNNDGL